MKTIIHGLSNGSVGNIPILEQQDEFDWIRVCCRIALLISGVCVAMVIAGCSPGWLP